MVDPIGFVSKVENTEKSAGGTDIESDQSMAERIYLAPSSYSTAGPDDAYEYWIKESDPNIGDVKISSPTPGVVDIRFVMKDGSIPNDTIIAKAESAVNQRSKRPLTDKVQVKKPEIEEYGIDITYYINRSDQGIALAIRSQTEAAVKEYQGWQDAKVGRDINPDELIARINSAGAKRIIVREPAFCVVEETVKPQCTGINVVYGGLEDD